MPLMHMQIKWIIRHDKHDVINMMVSNMSDICKSFKIKAFYLVLGITILQILLQKRFSVN